MQINEEQIRWYDKEDYKAKEEKKMEPSAVISARMIALNKSAAIFTEDDRIMIGTIKQGKSKKIILRAQTGDDYTPFKCSFSKTGAAAIRCASYVRDVLAGELGLDLTEKKRIKCPAQVDEESRTVVISAKG